MPTHRICRRTPWQPRWKPLHAFFFQLHCKPTSACSPILSLILQEDEEDALAAEVDAQFQELFTALQAERDRLATLQVRGSWVVCSVGCLAPSGRPAGVCLLGVGR